MSRLIVESVMSRSCLWDIYKVTHLTILPQSTQYPFLRVNSLGNKSTRVLAMVWTSRRSIPVICARQSSQYSQLCCACNLKIPIVMTNDRRYVADQILSYPRFQVRLDGGRKRLNPHRSVIGLPVHRRGRSCMKQRFVDSVEAAAFWYTLHGCGSSRAVGTM